jgi:hypothetical protein
MQQPAPGIAEGLRRIRHKRRIRLFITVAFFPTGMILSLLGFRYVLAQASRCGVLADTGAASAHGKSRKGRKSCSSPRRIQNPYPEMLVTSTSKMGVPGAFDLKPLMGAGSAAAPRWAAH